MLRKDNIKFGNISAVTRELFVKMTLDDIFDGLTKESKDWSENFKNYDDLFQELFYHVMTDILVNIDNSSVQEHWFRRFVRCVSRRNFHAAKAIHDALQLNNVNRLLNSEIKQKLRTYLEENHYLNPKNEKNILLGGLHTDFAAMMEKDPNTLPAFSPYVSWSSLHKRDKNKHFLQDPLFSRVLSGYSPVLMSIEVGVEIDIKFLEEVSKKSTGNPPILIKQGNRFFLYGCVGIADQVTEAGSINKIWKLTELNAKVFLSSGLSFPPLCQPDVRMIDASLELDAIRDLADLLQKEAYILTSDELFYVNPSKGEYVRINIAANVKVDKLHQLRILFLKERSPSCLNGTELQQLLILMNSNTLEGHLPPALCVRISRHSNNNSTLLSTQMIEEIKSKSAHNFCSLSDMQNKNKNKKMLPRTEINIQSLVESLARLMNKLEALCKKYGEDFIKLELEISAIIPIDLSKAIERTIKEISSLTKSFPQLVENNSDVHVAQMYEDYKKGPATSAPKTDDVLKIQFMPHSPLRHVTNQTDHLKKLLIPNFPHHSISSDVFDSSASDMSLLEVSSTTSLPSQRSEITPQTGRSINIDPTFTEHDVECSDMELISARSQASLTSKSEGGGSTILFKDESSDNGDPPLSPIEPNQNRYTKLPLIKGSKGITDLTDDDGEVPSSNILLEPFRIRSLTFDEAQSLIINKLPDEAEVLDLSSLSKPLESEEEAQTLAGNDLPEAGKPFGLYSISKMLEEVEENHSSTTLSDQPMGTESTTSSSATINKLSLVLSGIESATSSTTTTKLSLDLAWIQTLGSEASDEKNLDGNKSPPKSEKRTPNRERRRSMLGLFSVSPTATNTPKEPMEEKVLNPIYRNQSLSKLQKSKPPSGSRIVKKNNSEAAITSIEPIEEKFYSNSIYREPSISRLQEDAPPSGSRIVKKNTSEVVNISKEPVEEKFYSNSIYREPSVSRLQEDASLRGSRLVKRNASEQSMPVTRGSIIADPAHLRGESKSIAINLLFGEINPLKRGEKTTVEEQNKIRNILGNLNKKP